MKATRATNVVRAANKVRVTRGIKEMRVAKETRGGNFAVEAALKNYA
jgi:hypothetical protein